MSETPRAAIDATLDLLPRRMDSPAARVMLVAIGLQESRFKHRAQIVAGGGRGPARGFWQFERGGVVAVLHHRASRHWSYAICAERQVHHVPDAIWPQLEYDDVLAAAFARLLLWTDARPLPAVGDAEGAWDYYLRNWRPGRPHEHTWGELYERAVREVTGIE